MDGDRINALPSNGALVTVSPGGKTHDGVAGSFARKARRQTPSGSEAWAGAQYGHGGVAAGRKLASGAGPATGTNQLPLAP